MVTPDTQSTSQPQPVTQLQDQLLQPVSNTQQPAPQAASPDDTVMNPGAKVATPVADPNANHPLVQKAGLLHTIATTLAGGPRYKTEIDPNTGATKRTPIPLDRKDIGMAIAMSAITGALSGMQAKGTNANAQAAGLGFNAVAKQRSESDKEADAQASADFARKASLTEHNMHMMQLTAALGHDSENNLQDHVNKFADMRNEQDTPAISDVSEDDLRTKYAGQAGKLGEMATKYLSLPSRVVPRYDADGKQMTNAEGVPQFQLLWNLYDQTKQMPLTQDFLNKAASYGVPGSVKSDGTPYTIGEGATISAPTYAKMIRGMEAVDIFQRDLDSVAEATKTKPANAKSLVKADPSLLPAITQYLRDHGAAQNPAEAVAFMGKDPKAATYAPRIVAAFGPDAFEKYKSAQKANEEAAIKTAEQNTPEGQASLKNKQLENQKLQNELNQENTQAQGLAVPKNFTPNPDASSLSSTDLQKDLQTKGVKLPANFETLYSVAHNAADLKTLPTNPRKGSNQMSAQEGLGFIRQYINPQYQEGDYAAASGLSKELASTRQGTAGGALLSAGVASNHLDLLEQASTALANHDVQKLNHLANSLGVELGESPAVTFQAIAEQVNGEVGKVVAGGTPHEAELENLRKNLNSDQSPEQVREVIKSYIGLMAGRVNEINDRSQQYFGRDVKGISPVVTRVFNKYGFAVGSQVQVVDPTGKVRIFPDKKSADKFKKVAGIQ